MYKKTLLALLAFSYISCDTDENSTCDSPELADVCTVTEAGEDGDFDYNNGTILNSDTHDDLLSSDDSEQLTFEHYIESESSDSSQGQTTSNSRKSLGDRILDTAFDWFIKMGFLFTEKTVFTISYSEGYNINFAITKAQARSLLPENITPIKLKILESDPEPLYYLTMYLAGMESGQSIERVDLFTYGRDQKGDLTMFFLAGIMELPLYIRTNPISTKMFKMVLEHMASDSRTGEPSYPHYYTDTIAADSDSLFMKYQNSFIKLDSCSPVTTNQRFSRDFVLVNSQIYRNDLDKNVNYFNQSFIDAKVETRNLNCVTSKNLTEIHPMLVDLKSVQYYGSKDKTVTWYFEM